MWSLEAADRSGRCLVPSKCLTEAIGFAIMHSEVEALGAVQDWFLPW